MPFGIGIPNMPRFSNRPDGAFNFYIEVDGIRFGSVTEVQGLEWKVEPESFYEGGNPEYKVNLVGRGSYSKLTLRKGFFSGLSEFWMWIKGMMKPNKLKVPRVTMSVVVCNDAGEEVGRYNLYRAFICSYKGPTFNSMQDAVAFEEVEIAYDYFEYIPGPILGKLVAMTSGAGSLGKVFGKG